MQSKGHLPEIRAPRTPCFHATRLKCFVSHYDDRCHLAHCRNVQPSCWSAVDRSRPCVISVDLLRKSRFYFSAGGSYRVFFIRLLEGTWRAPDVGGCAHNIIVSIPIRWCADGVPSFELQTKRCACVLSCGMSTAMRFEFVSIARSVILQPWSCL